MVRFTSIISHVVWLNIVAIGIASICMPLSLYWLLNSAANDLHHRALREHAETLARYLVLNPDGTWSLELPPGLAGIYSEAYGRYSYSVIDDAGRTVFSSLHDHSAIFPNDPRLPSTAFLEIRHGETQISGASIRKGIGNRSAWVQIAEDLNHPEVIIDDIVADFLSRVGWVTLPILVLLLLTSVGIFRHALRPVIHASERAKNIGPAHADVRLPTADMPDEVRPLVLAINQALDRLERGFIIQREFTADAAHELRTPLTLLRARIDTLSDRKIAETLRRDIGGMIRIVGQLLDIAELDTFSVDPHEIADLRSVCREVAEFMAPLALAQGKSIALSGAEGPVWVKGNVETLSRAIRNLVENAINYTPKDTTVGIIVLEGGCVSILDHGPGIPEAERELVFQRFWRRDRRRAGAGLGLSIVRQIVEAHGGTITLENLPSGGAVFQLSFAATVPTQSLSWDSSYRPMNEGRTVTEVSAVAPVQRPRSC
jgi:signal transduction histidine kinase